VRGYPKNLATKNSQTFPKRRTPKNRFIGGLIAVETTVDCTEVGFMHCMDVGVDFFFGFKHLTAFGTHVLTGAGFRSASSAFNRCHTQTIHLSLINQKKQT
jgi:hypothetical protein